MSRSKLLRMAVGEGTAVSRALLLGHARAGRLVKGLPVESWRGTGGPRVPLNARLRASARHPHRHRAWRGRLLCRARPEGHGGHFPT